MKKFLILTLLIALSPSIGNSKEPIKEFHRLIVLDSEKKIMVVKIKGTDFWVTPGLYSIQNDSINNKLIHLASEYGLTISSPILRGKLHLINSGKSSNRLFYVSNKVEEAPILPSSIEEIRWLPLNDTLNLITFPHISILLEKIIDNPKTIWSASIERYKEKGIFKAKLIDGFKSNK